MGKALADFLQFWQEWHGTWRFHAVLGIVLIAAWSVKAVIFRYLGRLAERTSTKLDDELLEALRWPARYWAVLLALIVAVNDLDERDFPAVVTRGLGYLMVLLVIFSVTLALSRVTVILLRFHLDKGGSGQRVTTLTASVIRVLWAIPGLLIVLRMMGITLAPALTALGVGGLAVSLALQSTFANFFSGFYVSLAGNIHKGDFIRLDNGQQGYVEDIRWRITTLRTLEKNIVIIPNSKLAEALVTNFTYPQKALKVSIPFGVGYDSDLDHVDRILREEAALAVGEVPGLLGDPPAHVRFQPGCAQAALEFSLLVFVTDFEAQFDAVEALKRRVFVRFRREGIVIPYAVQTIEVRQLPPLNS